MKALDRRLKRVRFLGVCPRAVSITRALEGVLRARADGDGRGFWGRWPQGRGGQSERLSVLVLGFS